MPDRFLQPAADASASYRTREKQVLHPRRENASTRVPRRRTLRVVHVQDRRRDTPLESEPNRLSNAPHRRATSAHRLLYTSTRPLDAKESSDLQGCSTTKGANELLYQVQGQQANHRITAF